MFENCIARVWDGPSNRVLFIPTLNSYFSSFTKKLDGSKFGLIHFNFRFKIDKTNESRPNWRAASRALNRFCLTDLRSAAAINFSVHPR